MLDQKSKSANETDMRSIAAINNCRIGALHAADYIAPRRFYHCLSSADGYMTLQLLSIDMCRVICQDMVQTLAREKSLYRGELKQQLSLLWRNKPIPGAPLPVCNETEQAICRNLTEDELLSFGCMMSHIDEVIMPELHKLANSVFVQLGKDHIANQAVMCKLLTCYLFNQIAIEIIRRGREVTCGSRYNLCINPLDYKSRTNAYELSNSELIRMQNIMQRCVAILARGKHWQIPYTTDMANGVTIIVTRMTDTMTVYRAALEGGVNCGHCTFEELERKVSSLEERRSAPAPAAPPAAPTSRSDSHVSNGVSASTPSDIASLFASKGWSVKAS